MGGYEQRAGASVLFRACALLGATGFLRAASFLFGAFSLLPAALFLGALRFLGAALLHARSRCSGGRGGVLGVDHAAAERRGQQAESKFLHDGGSFYGLVFLMSSEQGDSPRQYNTYRFTMQ